MDMEGAICSQRVIEVLSRLVSQRGAPLFMRSDNEPVLVRNAILEWITKAGIGTSHTDPGKPWQNGTDESFNGKFRDECLSLAWFRSRREARVVIEARRHHYNAVRPHSSLNYLSHTSLRSNTMQPLTKPLSRNAWYEKFRAGQFVVCIWPLNRKDLPVLCSVCVCWMYWLRNEKGPQGRVTADLVCASVLRSSRKLAYSFDKVPPLLIAIATALGMHVCLKLERTRFRLTDYKLLE